MSDPQTRSLCPCGCFRARAGTFGMTGLGALQTMAYEPVEYRIA